MKVNKILVIKRFIFGKIVLCYNDCIYCFINLKLVIKKNVSFSCLLDMEGAGGYVKGLIVTILKNTTSCGKQGASHATESCIAIWLHPN